MNALIERPKRTDAVRLAKPPASEWVFLQPAPEVRTVISKDADGRWLFNGRVVNAEHQHRDNGQARAQAMAREVAAALASASPEERERMLERGRAGVNSVEELYL